LLSFFNKQIDARSEVYPRLGRGILIFR